MSAAGLLASSPAEAGAGAGVQHARPPAEQVTRAALARAGACGPARLGELAAWLAIPSVSGPPAHAADLRRAAGFLEEHLRRAGAVTARVATAGAPVVVGRVAGPRGAPVVVVYGHYDVQPAGPGWTSPAFRPALRGGSLVARGANDDKGQLFAVIAALRAWREAGGLPCTVVVIAEGAEEIGSPGLGPALAAVARRVRPDVVLACDTERGPDGLPAVTVSQRGHAAMRLRVDAGGQPVHAGRLGGAVVDPSMVLARILTTMQAAVSAMTSSSAGSGSDGRPWNGSATGDSTIRRLAGGRATRGSGLERRITRCPALNIVLLRSGGGRPAVPALAEARLDLRLPAGADVRATAGQLARAAQVAAPAGVTVQVTMGTASPGYAAVPRPDVLRAADLACRRVYGHPLAVVRSGGSLPAARLLAQAFEQVPVLLGLGTPGGGAHGPDERLDVAGWVQAVQLMVRLFSQPLSRDAIAKAE